MTRTLLALLALAATPLAAQEMRTITDDSGTEVTFPAAPQRIVTLHDSQLTIPLIELGVLPAGSHGRLPDAGDPFIRSGMILTGTDFGNASIVWVGDTPADLERIAALAPDLILTTDWNEVPADQLRQIAPTVVVDTSSRSRDEVYRFLASIAGPDAEAQLARLEARYAAQIAQIRAVIPDAGDVTVSTFQIWEGTISAMHTYGNLGRVLRDAGFAMPAIIDSIPEGGEAEFSLESLPAFDADVIIGTYNTAWGNDLPAERDLYLNSVPGFCDTMFACREGQMFFLPRDESFSMSWDALGMTATAVLALLGGQDIGTRTE
jgi:iron complex transport system substrate-binding protein